MVADVLAPCVARTSASMILNMFNRLVLVLHEERFQQPGQCQCSCLTWGNISTTWAMSDWRNDINCRHIFMFPMINLAREWLIIPATVPERLIHTEFVVITLRIRRQRIVPWKTWLKFCRRRSEGWEFESLSGRNIFCLKNFDTFKRTSVRVSKMNAVAPTQLTFQMLILLPNIYIASIHKHVTAYVWPFLIAQMVRAFGMNPKIESPSGRDIFCRKNFDTFTRTSVRVSKMNIIARTQ